MLANPSPFRTIFPTWSGGDRGCFGKCIAVSAGVMWLRMAVILWLASLWARGQAWDACISCGKEIRGEILMGTSPYYKERQPVCTECSKLEKWCFTCRLPAKKHLDLKDGRILCMRDAKTAVLSGEDAKVLFEEIKRDMRLMLRGSKNFPDRNITFGLVDRLELEGLGRLKRFPSTHNSVLGLTRSRSKGDSFEHNIDVIAGMPRNKFLGVCAHEYGHAWMQENLIGGRTLDSDTVEGFCELLAYKYICDKRDDVEKKLLLENDYTNGQIDVFVKAESDYNFYHVMKWVIGGQDSTLWSTNIARLLVLKHDEDATAAVFAWPPPKAARTVAPTNLTLKGISGTAKRRFALINGETLAVNESAKIPLGDTTVVV